jgi:hypothetical protein
MLMKTWQHLFEDSLLHSQVLSESCPSMFFHKPPLQVGRFNGYKFTRSLRLENKSGKIILRSPAKNVLYAHASPLSGKSEQAHTRVRQIAGVRLAMKTCMCSLHNFWRQTGGEKSGRSLLLTSAQTNMLRCSWLGHATLIGKQMRARRKENTTVWVSDQLLVHVLCCELIDGNRKPMGIL